MIRMLFARVASQRIKAMPLSIRRPVKTCGMHRTPRKIDEAACYDCLMSYYNQMDHRFLDRPDGQGISHAVQASASATLLSPQTISRAEHYQHLLNLCQSDLEREWLALMEKGNFRLPSHAQFLLEACHTRPDVLL